MKVKVYKNPILEEGFEGLAVLIKRISGLGDDRVITGGECSEQVKTLFISEKNYYLWELEDKQMDQLIKVLKSGKKGLTLTVSRELCSFFTLERWIVEFSSANGKKFITQRSIRVFRGRRPMHLPFSFSPTDFKIKL